MFASLLARWRLLLILGLMVLGLGFFVSTLWLFGCVSACKFDPVRLGIGVQNWL